MHTLTCGIRQLFRFHNLSDVVSLYIAFWYRDTGQAVSCLCVALISVLLYHRAVQAAKRESNDKMSYGWVRSEILGGLTNGCFLLSLCLYVALESIPRFIDPPGAGDAQHGANSMLDPHSVHFTSQNSNLGGRLLPWQQRDLPSTLLEP